MYLIVLMLFRTNIIIRDFISTLIRTCHVDNNWRFDLKGEYGNELNSIRLQTYSNKGYKFILL